jgi:hypothetical protein
LAARLAWRGSPRGSLVALRHRLSPVMPLSPAPREGRAIVSTLQLSRVRVRRQRTRRRNGSRHRCQLDSTSWQRGTYVTISNHMFLIRVRASHGPTVRVCLRGGSGRVPRERFHPRAVARPRAFWKAGRRNAGPLETSTSSRSLFVRCQNRLRSLTASPRSSGRNRTVHGRSW